jgi:predicted nuclease of restriction endonuclease-like (RecB) superfamily
MKAKGPSKRSDHDALLPEGYPELLAQLQERIRSARFQATLAVNRALVLLYWRLGADILARQKAEGWGAGVIDRLSRDLRRAFPDRQGFSPRNLTYMRDFAEAWPEGDFLQQVAAKLPWGHHQVLLDRLKEPLQREWYARAALQ